MILEAPPNSIQRVPILRPAFHKPGGRFILIGLQANPIVSSGTAFNYGSDPASITIASSPGDMAVDALAGYVCGSFSPGEGQVERWDVNWTNPNWVRRAATSTEFATGTEVTMSYNGAWPTCDWAHIAVVFRAAGNGTPTPTPTASPTPTVTPTVPGAPSGVVWRSYYFAGSQRREPALSGGPEVLRGAEVEGPCASPATPSRPTTACSTF